MTRSIERTRSLGDDKWEGVGWRRRSVFGALVLRPPLLDATGAEEELLRQAAAGARRVVEIGVFEGAAAAAMREAMADDGELVLVDPYPAGRLFGINMSQLVARRAVGKVSGGSVRWIRATSIEAVRDWEAPIDFLRIDGVHTLEGVQRDWTDWSRWVGVGGRVALRDDVVPAAAGAEDEFATGDMIVPWILESSSGWGVVERTDTTAVLRRNAA